VQTIALDEQSHANVSSKLVGPCPSGEATLPSRPPVMLLLVMPHEHLGVKRWPFPVVPSPASCDFIADRTQLREDVEGLLRTLSRQDASSIHLLWSWFGAGKTHTLFYLANRAAQLHKQGATGLHTVYSEFPKSARSFVDLYRSFAQGLDIEDLIEAYLEISTSTDSHLMRRDLVLASHDLVNALHVAATGESVDQVTAMRWLRGESLPVAQFRQVGISQKIGSAEEAGRILTALVRLLALSSKSKGRESCRVIWFLDEFQHVENLPAGVRREINTGLHSTFNACPTGLSIVLSFSGRPQDTLPAWFSPELRDRVGRTKVMILPPMRAEEAMEFIKDVLKHLRTLESFDAEPFFPFTEETCRFIIDDIQREEELKPRAIMHAFNAVLQEADPKIEAGKITTISPEFAKGVLAEHVPLPTGEENS